MAKFIIIQQFEATVTRHYEVDCSSKEEALQKLRSGLLEPKHYETDEQQCVSTEIGIEGENLEEVEE